MHHRTINDIVQNSRRARSPWLRTPWVTLLAGVLLVVGLLGCENQQVSDMPPAPAYPFVDVAHEIDDQDITTFLEHKLDTARGVQADSINVETLDGVVTLLGSVDNILAQERAARIAATVKGVRSVVNQITMQPFERSDSAIQVDLIRALDRDPVTEPWEVTVRVDSGVVTLTGTVDSWQERDLAAKTAKGVRGVRSLHNDIEINHTTLRTDADIKEDIENALKWHARVDDALIEVRVDDGAVALNGTVGSAYERSLAAISARVDGVRSVDTDGLFVSWWTRDDMQRDEWVRSRTDAEIEQALNDALRHDPRVASSNIEVSVAGGIAVLTDTVDNLKAKRAAAQDAANTVGVWQVDNLLIVRPPTALPDADIAAQVRVALLVDPYVEKLDVRVSVDEGEVTLDGVVDSYFQKWQAEDVAARVRGVVDVENSLVTPDELFSLGPFFYDWDPVFSDDVAVRAGKSDAEILADIQTELFWSPFIDEDDITVSVEDGVAALAGAVDTWYEYNTAVEKAFEAGATEVDNNLHVTYGPESALPQ